MSPQDTPAKPWLRGVVLLCGGLAAAAISLGKTWRPAWSQAGSSTNRVVATCRTRASRSTAARWQCGDVFDSVLPGDAAHPAMPNADPGIEDPSASLIFLPSADRRSLHSDPVVGKF